MGNACRACGCAGGTPDKEEVIAKVKKPAVFAAEKVKEGSKGKSGSSDASGNDKGSDKEISATSVASGSSGSGSSGSGSSGSDSGSSGSGSSGSDVSESKAVNTAASRAVNTPTVGSKKPCSGSKDEWKVPVCKHNEHLDRMADKMDVTLAEKKKPVFKYTHKLN